MKKRNNYSKEFEKRVAVKAIRSNKTLAQTASEFDVHVRQVRDWKKVALEATTET